LIVSVARKPFDIRTQTEVSLLCVRLISRHFKT